MRLRSLVHITLSAIFSMASTLAFSQVIVDQCLFTTSVGPGFETTADIANEPVAGADMVAYTNGVWTGGAGGAGLSIAPPVECTYVKAVFLRVTGGNGEGVGFRIGNGLNIGVPYSIEFTYVSHGAGSGPTFQPRLYSSNSPVLFNEEGELQGTLINNMPEAGNTWETNTINFTGTNANAGHNYLWVYANTSSGMVMNPCQMDSGPIEIDLPPVIEACEGETVEIGDPDAQGATILWNTGATTPTINVTESGLYSVNASNVCNSISDATTITFYSDPELLPATDTVMCLGSTFELETIGFNEENLWFDGSTDSTYTVTEPGIYSVTITDDCGASFIEIEVTLDSIPAVDLGADTALCYNEPLSLNAFLDDPEAEYLWNTGVETPQIDVVLNESFTYAVDVTNICGTGTDSRFVEYSLYPDDLFDNDYEICFGIPFILDASIIEGDYEWKNGSSDSQFQVPSPGFYWVTIEDDDDCWVYSDTTVVNVVTCACPVWLPNSFTPNNDGNNDVFAPVFECAPYDYKLDIYDRWGRIVYTLLDPSETWNGKVGGEPLRDGIYTFQLFYREVYDGIPIIKAGHIALLNY